MKVKEPWKICSRLKKTKGTCQLNVNLIHGHNLLRQKKKKRDGIGSQNFKQPTRWMENWLYKGGFFFIRGGFFDNSKQLWRQVIKFEWVLQTR